MKHTIALLSVLGAAAAQGVTESIAPDGSYPDGCFKDFNGQMEVTVATVVNAQKRSPMPLVQKRRQCGADGVLVMTLANGVLTDAKGRTGYVADNNQFQFDAPPQAGAVYTAGFSVCSNGSLALGSSATFYECASGSFWNLYNKDWAEQCEPVQISAMPCGGEDPSGYAGQGSDGQVVATDIITTTIVKPISDGQPQVITTTIPVPMCQIDDGQVQMHTTPCASMPTPQPASSPAPVSQYTDGQIQVTPPCTEGCTAPTPGTTAPSVPDSSAPAPVPTAMKTSSSPQISIGPSVSVPSPSAPASSPSPSAPAQSNAVRIEMSSLAALVVGLVGALCL